MKTVKITIVVLCALSVVPLYGQTCGRGAPQAPATNTVATAIPGVVAAGTPVTVIKEGFQGTEGPIALPDGSLIFTEPGANRISKIDKDGNVSVFLENTNSSNGLAFDSKGRLISTQTAAGQERIGVVYPKGSEATLAEKFGRPNDLVVNKAGGIYFTAPGAARQPLFYIPPGGAATKVNEDIDESQRHSAEPRRENALRQQHSRRIHAGVRHPAGRQARQQAELRASTKASRKTIPESTSGADGIAVDNDGRVYAAINSTGGVQVFSPEGKYLGTIPTSLGAQNIAFAGPDKKTLYIVGRGAAFKVQMLSQGFTGRAK